MARPCTISRPSEPSRVPATASPTAATEHTASGRRRPESGPAGRVETLERLAALRDRGAITNDEYQAEKTHVMNNGT